MKLQDQVCSIEQAKRLLELGVIYEYPTVRIHTENGQVCEWFMSVMHKDADKFIPVFTVAELGVMLPVMRTKENDSSSAIVTHRVNPEWAVGKNAECANTWMCYAVDEDGSLNFNPTEAQARAAMLIHLLENNHTTADEVNQSLLR